MTIVPEHLHLVKEARFDPLISGLTTIFYYRYGKHFDSPLYIGGSFYAFGDISCAVDIDLYTSYSKNNQNILDNCVNKNIAQYVVTEEYSDTNTKLVAKFPSFFTDAVSGRVHDLDIALVKDVQAKMAVNNLLSIQPFRNLYYSVGKEVELTNDLSGKYDTVNYRRMFWQYAYQWYYDKESK